MIIMVIITILSCDYNYLPPLGIAGAIEIKLSHP